MTGAEAIAKERRRQVERFGFGRDHDARYEAGELAGVAARMLGLYGRRLGFDLLLPSPEWWRDAAIRAEAAGGLRELLIVAGAMIAAEVDRLDAIARAAELGNRGAGRKRKGG